MVVVRLYDIIEDSFFVRCVWRTGVLTEDRCRHKEIRGSVVLGSLLSDIKDRDETEETKR